MRALHLPVQAQQVVALLLQQLLQGQPQHRRLLAIHTVSGKHAAKTCTEHALLG